MATKGQTPPVLILDQFEDILKRQDLASRREVRGLLVSTIQEARLCRWVLAYREDYHGEVCRWLEDPYEDQLTVLQSYHVNLRTVDRFSSWTLKPLGVCDPDAFYHALRKPLSLPDAPWPWRIDDSSARRLSDAFMYVRRVHPADPLVPEFQAVVAHLMEVSNSQLDVPSSQDEVMSLIVSALTSHVERRLYDVFPDVRRRQVSYPSREVATYTGAQRRGHILAVLLYLTDENARRSQRGLPLGEVLGRLGEGGDSIVEKLSSARARLLVPQMTSDGIYLTLSHDSVAEVLHALASMESNLFDVSVIRADKLIGDKVRALAAGDPSARYITPDQQELVASNMFLIWNQDRQDWWRACRKFNLAQRTPELKLVIFAIVTIPTLLAIALHMGGSRSAPYGGEDCICAPEGP